MENLGKTNGVAGLRELTSREDQKNEANAQLLANNDQHLAAIGAQLVETLSTRVDILIEYPMPERVAELFDRLDSVERAVNGLEDNYREAEHNCREAALAVCGENDEGFVREDDMPDQISRHCGVTLDPDEISELIKKTVVEILLHNVCIGVEPHGDPKLESAVLD